MTTTNNHPNVERFARFARHIEDLCRAFHVTLVVQPHMPPHMAGAGFIQGTQQVYVQIAPVIDDTTYGVALHELGHCCSVLGMVNQLEGSEKMRRTNNVATLRDVRLQLDEEYAAWEWARYHALEWTDAMAAIEKDAVNSYIKGARRFGVKEKLR